MFCSGLSFAHLNVVKSQSNSDETMPIGRNGLFDIFGNTKSKVSLVKEKLVCVLKCFTTFLETPDCSYIFSCSYDCIILDPSDKTLQQFKDDTNWKTGSSDIRTEIATSKMFDMFMCATQCVGTMQITDWKTWSSIFFCLVQDCCCKKPKPLTVTPSTADGIDATEPPQPEIPTDDPKPGSTAKNEVRTEKPNQVNVRVLDDQPDDYPLPGPPDDQLESLNLNVRSQEPESSVFQPDEFPEPGSPDDQLEDQNLNIRSLGSEQKTDEDPNEFPILGPPDNQTEIQNLNVRSIGSGQQTYEKADEYSIPGPLPDQEFIDQLETESEDLPKQVLVPTETLNQKSLPKSEPKTDLFSFEEESFRHPKDMETRAKPGSNELKSRFIEPGPVVRGLNTRSIKPRQNEPQFGSESVEPNFEQEPIESNSEQELQSRFINVESVLDQVQKSQSNDAQLKSSDDSSNFPFEKILDVGPDFDNHEISDSIEPDSDLEPENYDDYDTDITNYDSDTKK